MMATMGAIKREVKIGVIGLGSRGIPQLKVLLAMDDVTIAYVCDCYQDRVLNAQSLVLDKKGIAPKGTTHADELLQYPDIEAVIIMTGWESHIELAIKAMKAGKVVGLEVGGASTTAECWKLIEASETTGLECMLLENCCYGKEEMTLLNMVRKGIFGEIVHCQGGYQHDLREEIGLGDKNRHYRQGHFLTRNGELYPTHELGPIAKYINLNRGNRMLSLVSMASKAVGQNAWLAQNRPDSPLAAQKFNQGDIITTLIKCAGGETIVLTHDCTLPRAYSRGGRLQGTKGLWMEDNRSVYFEGLSPHDPTDWAHRYEKDDKYMQAYCHPLWREYEAFGLRGGHGGMDYLVLRAFIESIQDAKPFPIDVYDTASWMCITALSEQSIAMGSMPVAVPDFTNGRWIKKRPYHVGLYSLEP